MGVLTTSEIAIDDVAHSIDLGRTFSLASPDGDDRERDLWRHLRKQRGEPQDWGWLLMSPLVVILDEAGAGKTVEFRRQVSRLRHGDADAFFVRIERLCQNDLIRSLDQPEDASRLASWKASKRIATFFLDSVDEAKLPKDRVINPLQAAIRRLEMDVGSRWARVRLVISSRPSAWSAELELAEARRVARRFEAFGVRGAGDDTPTERYVRFDPLDAEQQTRLGAHDGAPDEFVSALYGAGVEDLAGTPLDLLDMSAAFQAAIAAGRPGDSAFESLSKVVDGAIERRASDAGTDTPRTMLPPARIRAGARRLAYACVVSHQLAVRLPGGDADGVDPLAVLRGAGSEWSRQDIAQLLATGLFTAAWAGSVRFHHRRTMERLAAEAFDELLQAGLEARVLADTLMPSAFGKHSLPPPFAETVGWLATLNPAFRSHVLTAAPHALIELGDPGVLPVPVREGALRGHVERYADVSWRGEWFPNGRLVRFVHPLLADICIELLKRRGPQEPLGHVLQIIELGKLGDCADAVADLVTDANAEIGLRTRAIYALVHVGRPEHLEPLARLGRALAVEPGDRDRHRRHDRNLFRIACATVGRPFAMSLAQAVACLVRLEPEEERHFSLREQDLIHAVVDECRADELPRLIRWLARVSWMPATRRFGDYEPPRWSRLGAQLLPLLEIACARCLEARPDLHDWGELAVQCDRLLAARQVSGGPLERYGERERDRFVEAIQAAPALRRRMFIMAVGDEPRQATRSIATLGRWRRASGQSAEAATAVRADLVWLEDLLVDTPTEAVRIAARHSLIGHVANLPARHEFRTARRRVLAAARRRGDALTVSALTWRPYDALRRTVWAWRRHADSLRWRVRRRFGKGWWLRTNAGLLAHVHASAIAVGKRELEAIRALYGRPHDRKKPFDRVRQELGERVAVALREGAKACANRHDPGTLGSRRTYLDRYAALGWDCWALDEPSRLEALEPDVARRALAATLKEDEFPDWARTLASRLPMTWREVVGGALAAELAERPHPFHPRYAPVLSRAARSDAALREPLARIAFEGLEANPGMNPEDVSNAAIVAVASPPLHPPLKRLAERRARDWLAVGAVGDAASWLRVWLHLDPVNAWAALRGFRDGPWMSDDGLMANLAAELRGFRLSSQPLEGQADMPPGQLGEIAIDLKKHVRSEDDLERQGDVTGRHNAQELRDAIPKMISQIPTAAAQQTLLRLKAEPLFADWAGYLARMIEEQAVGAAEPRPWSANDVVEFARAWTTRPGNAAELTAFIERQLRSILSDLENSEFDLRGLFRCALEKDVRAYLGAVLQDRSRGWYSVTQESVTAGEARRDLRIEGRSTQGEIVTVELKLAGDSWSGTEIVEHLESQLVRQYLISRQVRCGLYLVVALNKRVWPMPDGTSIGFEELSQRLDAEAKRLAPLYPEVEILNVVTHRVSLPASPRTALRSRTSSSARGSKASQRSSQRT